MKKLTSIDLVISVSVTTCGLIFKMTKEMIGLSTIDTIVMLRLNKVKTLFWDNLLWMQKVVFLIAYLSLKVVFLTGSIIING